MITIKGVFQVDRIRACVCRLYRVEDYTLTVVPYAQAVIEHLLWQLFLCKGIRLPRDLLLGYLHNVDCQSSMLVGIDICKALREAAWHSGPSICQKSNALSVGSHGVLTSNTMTYIH